ncbi:MAG: hypothetical protein AVDCRST_MAG69-903, partial [uncultured Solirubrobacteraceae bacterium]
GRFQGPRLPTHVLRRLTRHPCCHHGRCPQVRL